MPIIVQWYEEEQKNIHYDVVDMWTWDDLTEAIDEAMVLLDSVDYKVNLIIDFSNTGYIPNLAFAPLSRVAHAPTMNHANTNQFILVGANKYISNILSVFMKMFPFVREKYVMANTQEKLNTLI